MKQIFAILFATFLVSCFTPTNQVFQNLIGFSPTDDVKNLNIYTDEIGIDAAYWLSFNCEDTTVSKIVNFLQLEESSVVDHGMVGGLNSYPTKWWDTSFVEHAKPFKMNDDDKRLFWFLWYDRNNRRPYFLTGDY